MKQSPLERKLTDLFDPVIRDAGFRLVCVKVTGQIVQVMAEDPATRRIGVDDCAKISRELGALLEVEDPIKGAYRLEVGSPGIDRPLITAEDFADFAGFEAKVEIFPPLEGQKRFRGRLTGADGRTVTIETDQGPVSLPFAAIEKARLVLTDELINATKGK